jgi:Fungal specific transcription factor domain
VKTNFGVEKDGLITRYRLGTEQALEQADFLNHPDMTLLQALTIYLSVLQYTGETKVAWALIGVLIRVALAMKLHIDGSKLAQITVFDTEMRRRLWWQICFIDSRSEVSQVFAFKISQDMFDTEMPTNTNDADLHSSMSRPPPPSEGWTDMSAFLLRCEIWRLSRQLQSITDINRKREALERSEVKIVEKYLTQVDPNQPIQSFIETSVRLFLTKLELMLSPKPNYGNMLRHTESPPSGICTSCLAVIDYAYVLQNEPGWVGWRWQIQGRQPPWNALGLVLGHLSTGPWQPLYDRALASARCFLEKLPEAARTNPRYQQLLVLLSAAQKWANEHHPQNSTQSADVLVELLPPMDMNIVTSFAQTSINENTSTTLPQESFFDMPDYSGAEMDWQAWNEIAGDLEIWDIVCL